MCSSEPQLSRGLCHSSVLHGNVWRLWPFFPASDVSNGACKGPPLTERSPGMNIFQLSANIDIYHWTEKQVEINDNDLLGHKNGFSQCVCWISRWSGKAFGGLFAIQMWLWGPAARGCADLWEKLFSSLGMAATMELPFLREFWDASNSLTCVKFNYYGGWNLISSCLSQKVKKIKEKASSRKCSFLFFFCTVYCLEKL